MENRILEFIGHYNTAPFLFVGSGFSRRYLGLEDWEGLLKRFSTLNNVDYQYYFSSSGGKLPRIASLIAEDLHERWWKLPEYEKSRNRYKEYNTNKDIKKVSENISKLEFYLSYALFYLKE